MTSLMAAEWIKIRSVRSTIWTLALTVALSVGLAYLIGRSAQGYYPDLSAEEKAHFDPIAMSFFSVTLAQFALLVLAVFVMTSEFSTGTIRSSLTAVPQRGRFYAAKTLTGALVAAVAAAVSVLAAFLSAQAGLGPYGTSLRADGAAQAAIGGVIYLVLIFLFATGLAALFRNAIPTLGILLPLQFLSSQGLGNLPKVKTVAQFLPGDAGMSILRIVGQDFDPRFARPYGPWGGLGIVALWAAAALIAGYFALRRREA